MIELLVPLTYTFTGLTAYASLTHFQVGFFSPFDNKQLWFALTCLFASLMTPISLQALTASSVDVFVFWFRWAYPCFAVFFCCLVWFVAAYTQLGHKPLLIGLTGLQSLLILLNTVSPLGYPFDDIIRLSRIDLPWGEQLKWPEGLYSEWKLLGDLGIAAQMLYLLYLVAKRAWLDQSANANLMLLAQCFFSFAYVEALLLMQGHVDLFPLAIFASFGFVIAISTTLNRESNQTLRRNFSRVECERQRLQTLLSMVNDGIHILDPQGLLIQANPSFLAMLGQDSNIIGHYRVTDWDAKLDADAVKNKFEAAFNNGENVFFETRHRKRDGHLVDVEVNAKPIDLQEGRYLFCVSRDITQRKQNEDHLTHYREQLEQQVQEQTSQLIQTELRLRTIFNTMQDLMWLKDREGVYLACNHRTEQYFGVLEQSIIGKSDYDFFSSAEANKTREYDRRAMEAGQPVSNEEWVRFAQDSEEILLEVTRTPMFIEGEFVGVLGVGRDITQTRRTEDALREANEKAVHASQAKSEFLANMSHEIRTPMNGVVGMIDVLLHTSLNDEQRQMAEIIRDSAYAHLSVLTDILDFSKIEAGKLELAPTAFNLESLIANVSMMLDQMALTRKVEFTLFVDPNIPASLKGDPQCLRQILTNLVNNAIKFSSHLPHIGVVKIRAELMHRDSEAVWVRIDVEDNGIGITEMAQTKLFQPFAQADASSTRAHGGTGLGLVICKQLTELMGGNLQFRSVHQQGSVFSLMLPFEVLPELDSSEVASVKGLNCLVIGDNESVMSDIAIYLRHAGADVTTVPFVDAIEGRVNCDGMWIWIYDMTHISMDTIQAAVAQEQKKMSDGGATIRHLAVGRGRRRNMRMLAPGFAQVDANLLTRQTILQIMASLAAQTIAPMETKVDRQSSSLLTSLTREQALAQGSLILVAEDNEINQVVICEQLKMLGLIADVASDGKQALKQWENTDYALILSDIHMPNMDGHQLFEAVREHEAQSHRRYTPMIALTALALKEGGGASSDVPWDDYLIKPVPLLLLKRTLKKWLPKHLNMIGQESATPEPDPVETDSLVAVSAEVVDWEERTLSSIVGDDPTVNRRFLNLFLDKGREQCQAIEAAVILSDCKKMARIAHTFKSSARSVGAMRLGECCEALELSAKANDLENCQVLVLSVLEAFQKVSVLIERNLI